MTGGAGNDAVTGSSHSDTLTGGGGNDVIHGGLGFDELSGGAGLDWLDGGASDDLLIVAIGEAVTAGDRFTGGSGTDTLSVAYDPHSENGIVDLSLTTIDSDVENLQGSRIRLTTTQLGNLTTITANDLYIANSGALDFGGTQVGAYYLYLNDAGNQVNLAGTSFAGVQGGAAADSITGGIANEQIHGGGGNDMIAGGAGDDFLWGDAGADTLDGGAGNDTFDVDHSGDIVVEGLSGGNDLVMSSVSYALTGSAANVEGLMLRGEAAINATGNALDNNLAGNSGNNILDGGAGADSMSGGNGSDTYFVDNAGDVVNEIGSEGIDTVNSSVSYAIDIFIEKLTLTGTAAINGTGSSWGNVITGNSAANILDGGGGNDTLTGGGGSDTFRSTADGLNGDSITDLSMGERIVIIDASLAGFTFSLSGSMLTFTGGSLTLTGFSGRLIATAAAGGGVQLTVVPLNDARHDFNGDGRSDILWRNDDGRVTDWLGQSSGSFAGNTANANVNVGPDWNVAGVGDFNGDSRDDVIWRNDDGRMIEWLGQTNGGFAGNAGANYNVATSWHVAGVGDFNGDGRDDILWRNDNRTVTNWLGRTDGRFDGNTDDTNIQVGPDWQVAGVGDFNGDGRDDVIWRNDDGRLIEWLGQANGSFAGNAAGNYHVATSWHVAGVGDFNGDGRDDILWRNDDGRVTDWLGQPNGSFAGNGNASHKVGPNWEVAQIGDFNGDSRDDILWRSDSGAMIEWLGQPNGGFSGNAGANYNADPSWHVQSPDIQWA